MTNKVKTKSFFKKGAAIYQASAPGRLDVMGGIADYSGSMVLEMPIKQQATVKISLRNDDLFRVFSSRMAVEEEDNTVKIGIRDFHNDSNEIDYSMVMNKLSAAGKGEWAAYVIGCALILIKEKGAPKTGADIYVDSDVPMGKGVSSSAALEVAAMSAFAKAWNIMLKKLELPMLCQKVENLIVGAPCGLMDQLTCFFGEKDKLLPIICRPARILDPISLPKKIKFIGIDSGVRHHVSGASYSDVRTAAFMGFSLIALSDGASLGDLIHARETGDRSLLPYNGYLANIPVSTFEKKYKNLLPETISGSGFLEQIGAIIDNVTKVKKESTYRILDATRHPVYENHRVVQFALLLELLKGNRIKKDKEIEILNQLGELMYQSHASYSACGLGEPVTDELVELSRNNSPESGIFGAKITGGGSGGTVCFLCRGKTGIRSAKEIKRFMEKKYDKKLFFFNGSTPGARMREVTIEEA